MATPTKINDPRDPVTAVISADGPTTQRSPTAAAPSLEHVASRKMAMDRLARLRRSYWRARERWAERRGPVWDALQAAALRRRARRGDCIEIEGVKLRLGPHLSDHVLRFIGDGSYELPERRLLACHLAEDDVVMELGSGLGFLATLCARRVGSDRVFTYEANPALEPIIRDTFARNGVTPTLSMCMLGERAGTRPFFVSRHFWSSSSVPMHGECERVDVPVRAVNDELRRIRPTFLVIDIEGGERDLFDAIDLSGVRKLVVELHPAVIGDDGAAAIRLRLRRAGFTLAPGADDEDQFYAERTT